MVIDIHAQAGRAIHNERNRRGYDVIVIMVRRAPAIAGIPIPRELEAYVAETVCTVHRERPCLWTDFAFRLLDGRFRVVLQNDLVRPGMMIEESVRALFRELLREKTQQGEGHAE